MTTKTAQKRGKMKKEKALTNPNKINQHTDPDPRQTIFLAAYTDPKSKTFSNAYQSALAVGYSEEYAKVITSQTTWFSEALRDNAMLALAERNLTQALELPERVQAMGAFGPLYEKKVVKGKKVKVPVFTYSGSLLKYRLAAAKFVAERVGRKKYGKDSDGPVVPIQINIHSDRDAYA